MGEIEGISWDFWDTIIAHKNSDEIKKVDTERAILLSRILSISFEQAWNELKSHHPEEEGNTAQGLLVEERLKYLASKYQASFDIHTIAQNISSISLKYKIGLVDGIKKVLQESPYRHVSICNTKWTQGADLKQLMNQEQITSYFENCYFSDIGLNAKPSVGAFRLAWRNSIDLKKTLHIGDNLNKDILGAINIGARSIVCRVIKNIPHEQDKISDGVLYSYDGLWGLIDLIMDKDPGKEWTLIGTGKPSSEIKRLTARIGNKMGNISLANATATASAIISPYPIEKNTKIPGIYNFTGDMNSLKEHSLLLIDFIKGRVFKNE